jgi:hypothetical protein
MAIFTRPPTLFAVCTRACAAGTTRLFEFCSRAAPRASTFCSRAAPRASTLARTALFAAALLAPTACALNTRPGDGLVSEESSQNYAFGQVSLVGALGGAGALEGAGAGNGELIPCKNVPLFVQQALPHFIADCVKCHDYTDLRATLKFALLQARMTDPESQQTTCDITLTQGVTLADKAQSTIFTQVDPTHPEIVHDFKYPDVASYIAYRDAVMLWLQTE